MEAVIIQENTFLGMNKLLLALNSIHVFYKFDVYASICPQNCFMLCRISLSFPCSHSCESSDIQKGSNKANRSSSPCHDDKEIQSVPCVPEVTAWTKDSQGDHLYNHLQSEEDVDECIESLTERRQSDSVSRLKNEENVIGKRCEASQRSRNKKKQNSAFIFLTLLSSLLLTWNYFIHLLASKYSNCPKCNMIVVESKPPHL